MLAGIADTHTAIWYIFSNPRLSEIAKAFLDTAERDENQIGISSITLIEMVYLIEKGKIPAEAFTRLCTRMDNPNNLFTEVLIGIQVARSLTAIDATKVPDMPDRIIAATALHYNVPVISKDRKIQLSGLQTIW